MSPSDTRSIVIVGAGCFGIATALELSKRSEFDGTKIVLVNKTQGPDPDCSSYDINRIVRADYTNPLYAVLAEEALTEWQDGKWGQAGRFHQSGLLMLAGAKEGYIADALRLARERGQSNNVSEVHGVEEISDACKTDGFTGSWGYLNRNAGWADAAKCLQYAFERIQSTERVEFVVGKVVRLLSTELDAEGAQPKVLGIVLEDGREVRADLTVLATGAHSPLLVDLRGIAAASAEILAYIELTTEEAHRLQAMPAIINLDKGWFILPPNGMTLKIARHGKGFANIRKVWHSQFAMDIDMSTPCLEADQAEKVRAIGLQACREAVRELLPWLIDRPFEYTRICWYTDTTNGDFVIDYHPHMAGLFVATGGSGHAFKFLPVIGAQIVNAIQKCLSDEYRQLWKWPTLSDSENPMNVHEAAYLARGGDNKTVVPDQTLRSSS